MLYEAEDGDGGGLLQLMSLVYIQFYDQGEVVGSARSGHVCVRVKGKYRTGHDKKMWIHNDDENEEGGGVTYSKI